MLDARYGQLGVDFGSDTGLADSRAATDEQHLSHGTTIAPT